MTDKPTVIEALSAVMADVQAIRKGQKNTAPNANYMFRGIDAVMNAVGPALRTHGVVIVPESADARYRDVQTSTGKPTREVTVLVTFRAYGPAGDSIPIQAPGEAMDSGDKGTSKAMSVAYRTALLQALTIPTDEPDPDSHTYERARHEPTPRPRAAQTDNQRARMHALLGELGLTDRDKYVRLAGWHAHRDLTSTSDLSAEEAAAFIDYLAGRVAEAKTGAPA